MIDDDLLADLPAPSDDEPPSLRSDIADELADHLQCALRRELVKDGDVPAAESRALKRFGDPQRIARQLWWQAMWSHIMRQRLVTGLQWLLTSAAVILAGAVFWQQLTLLDEIRSSRKAEAENYQIITDAVKEIRANRSAVSHDSSSSVPEPDGDDATPIRMGVRKGGVWEPVSDEDQSPRPQSLTIKLVQETVDGPPVTDASVDVYFDEIRLGMNRNEAKAGLFSAQLAHPDRYQVSVVMSDGQQCRQTVVVRAKEHRELTVICPKPREKTVLRVTAPPLPQELQGIPCRLSLVLEVAAREINSLEWSPPEAHSEYMEFSPQGGPIAAIYHSGTRVDLELAKLNDRAVVLFSGPVRCKFQIDRLNVSENTSSQWSVTDEPEGVRTLEEGESHWNLELSEEFLARARKEFLSNPADAVGSTNFADKQPLGDRSLLIVTASTSTKEGPPPTNASIRLIVPNSGSTVYQFDSKGRCVIGPVEPGRYQLEVRVSRYRTPLQNVILRAGQERIEHFVCPAGEKRVPITVSAPPLPEDLRKGSSFLTARVSSRALRLEGREWWSDESTPLLKFNPETGALMMIDDSDLSLDADEDRVTFLPTGTYSLVPTLHFSQTSIFGWPLEEFEKAQPIFEAKPGENKWELKLPDGFWSDARSNLELKKTDEP